MTTTIARATDRQVSFLRSLADEVHGENAAEWLLAVEEGEPLTKARASALITSLLDAKRAAPKAPPAPKADTSGVPAARYGLVEADGTFTFWQVDRPKSGKWAGWTFVKGLRGNPADFAKVRVRGAEADAVLARIAAATYTDGERVLSGPEAAAVAFSREHGVCAACLSPLTDAESIARGLGPICAGRF